MELGNNAHINYRLLGQAITYYEGEGFNYIEVPWAVSKDVIDYTCPKNNKQFPLNDKFLVGSAEQSFLSLAFDGKLDWDKKYMAVTPCFRDEAKDHRFHYDYFIKLELFQYHKDWDSNVVIDFAATALDFFAKFSAPRIIPMDEEDKSYDILVEEIEVGSYIKRQIPNLCAWTCGTGLALPRFSEALHGL